MYMGIWPSLWGKVNRLLKPIISYKYKSLIRPNFKIDTSHEAVMAVASLT